MSELDPDCIFEDEREEGRAEKPPAPFWTVAIYLCDRVYGGPEEGGWYYDCGTRVDEALDGVPAKYLLSVSTDEDSAIEICRYVNWLLDETVNVGRREISSVLSTGRYYAQVHNGYPPAFYPTERPHYE